MVSTNDTRKDLGADNASKLTAPPGKFRGWLIPKITHTYTHKRK